jgi:hypothetical protein
VFRCGVCGSRMRTNVTQKVAKRYYYYICRKHHEEREACPNRKSHRADKVEPDVWRLISELLQKPEQLRVDLERMIEVERSGLQRDPDREIHSWSEKLTELNRKRARFQHSYAEGVIELDDLRARLTELDETREMAEREIEKLLSCRERIEQLERNKDTLLESFVGTAPEALDSLAPDERHQIYKMLQLGVTASANGAIELTGHLVTDPEVCHSGSASWLRLETS